MSMTTPPFTPPTTQPPLSPATPGNRLHDDRAPVAPIGSIDELEDRLSEPPAAVVEVFSRLEGDVLVLGAGGKMGPSLARMAARAARAAGSDTRIYAASRFPERALRDRLTGWGITPLVCDLAQPGAIGRLPYCSNVVFMAGRKFGSVGSEWETWASNVFLASEAARSFPRARIVAFSTGNVYPLWPISRPEGPNEETAPGPVGEYAQSCLGRERMFEYFSRRNGTLVTLLRLNYAVELRYGVLLDIATRVWTGQVVRLDMGHANVIWQGDASAYALQTFDLCSTPPAVLNVTGPLVRVRDVAEELGRLLDRPVHFQGTEATTALLSNPAECHARFGPPRLPFATLLAWIAHWVRADGPTLGKPTGYEIRDGRF
jgi:nucleoside-diphosphate-sugar epimerase